MKTVSMSGSPRENVGKKDTKKTRREGKVPCVIYGGKDQIHFTIEDKDFKKIIFTPNVYIINLSIDGKEYKAILKDVQYHPITDHFLHADFYEVFTEKPFMIAVPVKFEGNPAGVLLGGRLVIKMRKLLVHGLMNDMPDDIVIDISKLDIGDSVKVRDMQIDKVELMDMPSNEIVGVKTARGVEEEEEDEEGEEGEEGAEGAEGAEATEGGEKAPAAKSDKK